MDPGRDRGGHDLTATLLRPIPVHLASLVVGFGALARARPRSVVQLRRLGDPAPGDGCGGVGSAGHQGHWNTAATLALPGPARHRRTAQLPALPGVRVPRPPRGRPPALARDAARRACDRGSRRRWRRRRSCSARPPRTCSGRSNSGSSGRSPRARSSCSSSIDRGSGLAGWPSVIALSVDIADLLRDSAPADRGRVRAELDPPRLVALAADVRTGRRGLRRLVPDLQRRHAGRRWHRRASRLVTGAPVFFAAMFARRLRAVRRRRGARPPRCDSARGLARETSPSLARARGGRLRAPARISRLRTAHGGQPERRRAQCGWSHSATSI